MGQGKKKERILRILLNHPEGKLTKYKIAKLAQVSYPWVFDILKELEKLKLIKNNQVLSYRKLLHYWLKIYKRPKARYYSLPDPVKFLQKTRLEFALTTYLAENLVQHHLFPTRVDVYIREKDLQKWHKKLLKEGLYGRGNLKLIIEDEHVFYQTKKIRNLPIVSFPQLLLDLYQEGGICVEAGEMLLKKVKKYV